MKWVRGFLDRECKQISLQALLDDSLDECDAEAMEAHLSRCPMCQNRLTQLAGQSNWWLDAGRLLDPIAGRFDHCSGDFLSEHDSEEDRFRQIESELMESGVLQPTGENEYLGKLDRYAVRSVIGAGGTGIVLLADDNELNRTVAIKVLAPALAVNGPARKRFAREAQAVAAVANENVVAIHHVEASGKVPFLVMQYIDGLSLQDLIIRHGPIDSRTALRMTAQISAALAAAHDQGLVHRDVKPANILVGKSGQRVWITDFGLARAVDDASLTRTGFVAGTPHYMSPEQARGAVVGAGSDLFGLGSVMYFMLTGRPPFRAETSLAILNRICTQPHRPVREVNSDVPQTVSELIDRLLSKSPEERHCDADSVRRECMRLLATDMRHPGESSADSHTKNRLRRWLYGGVLAGGLIASVGTIHHLWAESNQVNRDTALTASVPDSPQLAPREVYTAETSRAFPLPTYQADTSESPQPLAFTQAASPADWAPPSREASTPENRSSAIHAVVREDVVQPAAHNQGFAPERDDEWNRMLSEATDDLATLAESFSGAMSINSFPQSSERFDREASDIQGAMQELLSKDGRSSEISRQVF